MCASVQGRRPQPHAQPPRTTQRGVAAHNAIHANELINSLTKKRTCKRWKFLVRVIIIIITFFYARHDCFVAKKVFTYSNYEAETRRDAHDELLLMLPAPPHFFIITLIIL